MRTAHPPRLGNTPERPVKGIPPERGRSDQAQPHPPREVFPRAADRTPLLIVHRAAVTRFGLIALLRRFRRFRVCAQTASAAEARALLLQHQPALLVAGLSLRDGDGFDLIKDSRKLLPRVGTIVLTTRNDAVSVRRAFLAGVHGYVVTDDDPLDIITALDAARVGQLHASASVWRCLLQELAAAEIDATNPQVKRLSNRELQIFRRLGAGHGRRQVARELHLSAKTVDAHREHIKEKLGLHSTAELSERAAVWMREELPKFLPERFTRANTRR